MASSRQLREFLVQNGVRALTSVAQIAAAVVLMFVYSPLLTLVFLCDLFCFFFQPAPLLVLSTLLLFGLG